MHRSHVCLVWWIMLISIVQLLEHYGNVWHHSRVRRYLSSEDWTGPESKGKPWYGLLMLLRKYPEHFVINTRSKGRITLEFVSLVSLLSWNIFTYAVTLDPVSSWKYKIYLKGPASLEKILVHLNHECVLLSVEGFETLLFCPENIDLLWPQLVGVIFMDGIRELDIFIQQFVPL